MTETEGRRLVDHWRALRARERLVLVGGGAGLTILLVVFLFWIPLQERLAQERRTLTERTATVQWMQKVAAEVAKQRALQGTHANGKKKGKGSILSLVDQTARSQGLSDALTRVEPEGTARVRLSFEKVSFNALMGWLALLDQRHHVNVQQLSLEAEGTTGKVRARLVLGDHGESG